MLWWPGAHSGKPESADYDSGARDLSPEPISLTLLMQSHDPSAVRSVQEMGSGKVLDLADRVSNSFLLIVVSCVGMEIGIDTDGSKSCITVSVKQVNSQTEFGRWRKTMKLNMNKSWLQEDSCELE